jgi:adenylosuccinate lyase
MQPLNAVSPIDGRYHRQTQPLTEFFSEYALIRYRVFVEIQYFIALCHLPLPQLMDFDARKIDDLNDIAENFNIDDALIIKEIEKITNHDVKAVEYFLRDAFDKIGLEHFKEFIHFGLRKM